MDRDAHAPTNTGQTMVVCLAIAVVVYVLSLGPVVLFVSKYGGRPSSALERLYYPLAWACKNCWPLEEAVDWYVSMWYRPARVLID